MKEEKKKGGKPRKKAIVETTTTATTSNNVVDTLTSENVSLHNRANAAEKMVDVLNSKLNEAVKAGTDYMNDARKCKDAYNKILTDLNLLESKLNRIPGFVKSLFGVK